jgi:hypothetical protein
MPPPRHTAQFMGKQAAKRNKLAAKKESTHQDHRSRNIQKHPFCLTVLHKSIIRKEKQHLLDIPAFVAWVLALHVPLLLNLCCYSS